MIKAGDSIILKFDNYNKELCKYNGKAYTYENMEQAKKYLRAGELDAILIEYVPKDRWIPVSEHLPTDEGWYQVWTKTKEGGAKSFNKAYFCHGNEWHGNGGRWANVTHWKPLPCAPNEEE